MNNNKDRLIFSYSDVFVRFIKSFTCNVITNIIEIDERV